MGLINMPMGTGENQEPEEYQWRKDIRLESDRPGSAFT